MMISVGFEHHFIQPCYIDSASIEENGVLFLATEQIVKEHEAGNFTTNAQMDGHTMKTVVMALSGGMDSTCLLGIISPKATEHLYLIQLWAKARN